MPSFVKEMVLMFLQYRLLIKKRLKEEKITVNTD